MTKAIPWIIITLLTAILACFAYCAVWLNAHTGPEERPRIDIIGCVQEVTFHERTVWYLDYMIDGYQQGVTLYAEEDIAPFIDRLRMVGDVYE
jgi:hypothetical protein